MNNCFGIIQFKYGYILVKYRVIIHCIYIYLHVYLSNVIFLKSFLCLLSVFSTITHRDTTSQHRCSVNLSYSRNPDHLHREGVNNKKGRDGQSPAPSPRPKRPTGRPPEGPDSDPIRIRAARELIKKIQIVTLNDDLGFYRPANWVNPTEKPTPP